MISKLILDIWVEQVRMLNTLTLNLNTLQHFSENIETKARTKRIDKDLLKSPTSDRKHLADIIESICDNVDDLISVVTHDWDNLSEDQQQEIRNTRFLIEDWMSLQTGFSGFAFWFFLLPESIFRKKDLHRCLVRSLSELECAISDKIARENIRIGWKEVMTGKTIPLSELWDGLDSD